MTKKPAKTKKIPPLERIANSLEVIASYCLSKNDYYKKAQEFLDKRSSKSSKISPDAQDLEPYQKIITFPRMNLKEIFEQSEGKTVNGYPLVWNFKDSWMRNEKFFTDEYTSPGEKIIDFRIIGQGKNWNECKELGEKDGKRMLNFAELFYLIWKHDEDVKKILDCNNDVRWTWVSTPVRAGLGSSGGWVFSGPGVGRNFAGYSDSDLGLGFSCIDS